MKTERQVETIQDNDRLDKKMFDSGSAFSFSLTFNIYIFFDYQSLFEGEFSNHNIILFGSQGKVEYMKTDS